jgi:uncharacterized protein YndB with AHSA1/START domain
MTITDITPKSQIESISFEFDLKHAPEKVWRALTDPTLLAQWLLPVTGLQLVPGTEFTLKAQAYPGWDGTVDCRMIEIDPQKKLSYGWKVPFLDTVVTFTLTPTASGTRLNIVQSGFKPDQKQESGGSRYGWKVMGERLLEVLGRMS